MYLRALATLWENINILPLRNEGAKIHEEAKSIYICKFIDHGKFFS